MNPAVTSDKSDGVSHDAKSLPILSKVNKEIHLNSKDRAFWWGALSEPLASLLQANQYSEEVQLRYLQWFYEYIPPALGPRPVAGRPFYGSWVTHDLSPFEYSLNWKEKSQKQTIRFTIEPKTTKAGSSADPINQLGAKQFLETVSKSLPTLELTRFNQFLEATNIPDNDADAASAKHPSHFPRSRVWIAFDLEHSGNLMAKSYFLPHWRAIQTGISANTIVFDAVRACNTDRSSYNGSLAAIESYLSAFPRQEDIPQVGLLSHDCVVDTPGSRLKVYLRSTVDTLATVKDMYSLGGRLKSTSVKTSLQGITDFWYHLFDLDPLDLDAEAKVCVPKHDKCIFVYEMRSSQSLEPDIDVKLHIPLWDLGLTDSQLSERLAAWFNSHGHSQLAGRYKADLETAL